MKLTITLSKEEGQGLTNYKNALVPPEVDMDTFVKQMFFLGLQAYKDTMMDSVKKYVEKNREELINAGVKSEDLDAFNLPSDNPSDSTFEPDGSVEITDK